MADEHEEAQAEQAGPADPMSQMAEGAAAAHETYLAYVGAGFTDAQALYLVGCITTAHIRREGT